MSALITSSCISFTTRIVLLFLGEYMFKHFIRLSGLATLNTNYIISFLFYLFIIFCHPNHIRISVMFSQLSKKHKLYQGFEYIYLTILTSKQRGVRTIVTTLLLQFLKTKYEIIFSYRRVYTVHTPVNENNNKFIFLYPRSHTINIRVYILAAHFLLFRNMSFHYNILFMIL